MSEFEEKCDQNIEKVLNEELIDNKSDESECEDMSDMPPLEDFMTQNNDNSVKKKNIIIEDKKEPKELDSNGWLDVLDNGDLKKFVIKTGEVGKQRPERGCIVVIKLLTKLYDTQQVVESESYDSIDIVLGESDVIQGIDLVIPLMDDKEVSRIVIKSRFAFGKIGKGSEIPPNSTLECELHVLSVEWPEDEVILPIDERIRIGNRKKERGNFWYGREDYSTAMQCYKSALKYLDASEEELGSEQDLKKHFEEQMKSISSNGSIVNSNERIDELIEIRSATFNNLAAVQLKIEAFEGALKSVDSVLMVQPNNVKALFRKGKILASKGELDQSIEILRKALTFDPDSKVIVQELSKYINKRKKELVTERDLYKRMLELDKNDVNDKGIDINNDNNKKSWLKWGLIGGAVTAAVASAVCYKVIQ